MKNSSTGACIALTLTLLSFAACQNNAAIEPEKSPSVDLLKVLISGVSDITPYSFKIKAESNTTTPSAVGVCWSDSNREPTIYDLKTVEKFTDKVFTIDINKLKPETTYFVRAFIIYHSKPIYSDVLTIKTVKKTADAIQKEG